MATATIAAIGSLLAGAGAVGGLFRNNQQQEQSQAINERAVQDAENNAAFQRALAVLVNQRSTAGTQDSFGSSLQYDPATNTWVSKLGPLPEAEQRAASQAEISRNTTDLRTAQEANQSAMRRATQAQPLADTAFRNLQNFKPMTSDELAGLMTGQAITANNAVMRPLIADTLRTYARSGTAAGPVLAEEGRQSYNNLRDALVTGRIQALQNTDQINNARRQGLESAATTASGLASPSLQFSGLAGSDQSKNLAALLADRAKTASTAPAAGQFGVNQATQLGQSALQRLAGGVPNTNFALDSATTGLKDLSALLKDKDTIGQITSLFGGSNKTDQPNPFGIGDPNATF